MPSENGVIVPGLARLIKQNRETRTGGQQNGAMPIALHAWPHLPLQLDAGLFIRNVVRLAPRFSVDKLIKIRDGRPLGLRVSKGLTRYVRIAGIGTATALKVLRQLC